MQNALLKNGKTLAIHPAAPADAADILAYCKQVGGETDYLFLDADGIPFTLQQEADYLAEVQKDESSVLYIGRVDGQMVAMAALATGKRRIAHVSELSITVAKAHWGTGAGGAMMQALLNFARNTGVIRMVHLGVRCDNVRAQGLYKKFGFAVCGRYPGFLHVGDAYFDEVLMCRTL